nr:hypothetical protein [uncultured Terrisporobacter sp.]
MKDKDIYDLIENIEDLDKLNFNYEKWEEFNLSDKEVEDIKNRTYEKIGYKKSRYNNRKIMRFVASICLVVILGTSAVLAFVGGKYKLDLASGRIIKSEKPVYILEKPITKTINNAKITLTSAIVNEKELVINEEINNLRDYKYIKHEIRINNKDILEEKYEDIEDTNYSTSYGRSYEYKNSDKIVFSVLLKDDSNKVTKLDYNIKLSEAVSMEQYNKYLPKDSNNNITVSATTKEKGNQLYIDLKAIPTSDNFDFQVDSFGNYNVINNKTNIFLVDSKGKKLEVEPEIKDRSGTRFKANIKNLQKPFTLEIQQINVDVDDLKSKRIKLPSLELNESKTINKIINISDSNNTISQESSKVLIKSVKRINSDGEEAYNIELDYPDNQKSPIKIRSLDINPILSPWRLFRSDMTGSSQLSSPKDNICRRASIYVSKNNKKRKNVSFEISGGSYLIEGKWKIKID